MSIFQTELPEDWGQSQSWPWPPGAGMSTRPGNWGALDEEHDARAERQWLERESAVYKAALAEAHAAGVAEEQARVVALLETARDDAMSNSNSDRSAGLLVSAAEEAAGAAMCIALLRQVRQ